MTWLGDKFQRYLRGPRDSWENLPEKPETASEPKKCTHNNISDCSAAGCPGSEE